MYRNHVRTVDKTGVPIVSMNIYLEKEIIIRYVDIITSN